MPKGKRQSPTDILREHGTAEEKVASADITVGTTATNIVNAATPLLITPVSGFTTGKAAYKPITIDLSAYQIINLEAFAKAVLTDNLEATSDILAGIRKRLRALKPKVARAVSTKRIDRAVAKIVTKYGKDQIIAALERTAINPQENYG